VRVSGVEWDEHNRAHLREHKRCSEEDVEDVLHSRHYPTRSFAQTTQPGAERRFMFHGRTRRGIPLKISPRRDQVTSGARSPACRYLARTSASILPWRRQ